MRNDWFAECGLKNLSLRINNNLYTQLQILLNRTVVTVHVILFFKHSLFKIKPLYTNECRSNDPIQWNNCKLTYMQFMCISAMPNGLKMTLSRNM
jgi:hypothetical protein